MANPTATNTMTVAQSDRRRSRRVLRSHHVPFLPLFFSGKQINDIRVQSNCLRKGTFFGNILIFIIKMSDAKWALLCVIWFILELNPRSYPRIILDGNCAFFIFSFWDFPLLPRSHADNAIIHTLSPFFISLLNSHAKRNWILFLVSFIPAWITQRFLKKKNDALSVYES